MAVLRCVINPSSNDEVELDTVLTSPSNRVLLFEPPLTSPFYAGYSIARQLHAGYSGPLVAIRRASDNAVSSFGFDGGGDLDTSAISTWLGSSDGYLQTLYDQGDWGLDFSQFEPSSQPKIATAGTVITEPNSSLPAWYNTTDEDVYLVCWVMNVVQPATYFLVINPTTYSGSDRHYFDGYDTDYRHLAGADSSTNLIKQYVSGGSTDNITAAYTGYKLLYALFDGTGSEMGVNGATATATSLATADCHAMVLGTGRKVSSPYPHYNSMYGYFQELIIYSNDDQSANRSTIESGINGYYSIY